ncbi:MAG: hypothetical protein RMJ19_06360 [Gemmatales bacterium]|nr:DivIVA domain-containing protein [Gemmatales bacterium]MDW8175277.1 hypothetical protein [Gemmatales bacterium]
MSYTATCRHRVAILSKALIVWMAPLTSWIIPNSALVGQSTEELLRENAALKERIRQLEARLAQTSSSEQVSSETEHRHHHDHSSAPTSRQRFSAFWGPEDTAYVPPSRYRYVDPYPPDWWKPQDNYRPYSWQPPPSEGFLRDLFFGPVVDTHRSPRGTPWVHPFTIEPAQIHRDLFFFYKFTKNAEGSPVDEHELEVHLDWGLTRRFGFVLAAPFLGLEDPAGHQTGFADMEFAPRIVWIESERFFLASNILFTFPTGDEGRGLGRGETTISPFLTTWQDIGSWRFVPWRNWNQIHLNFGPEVGLESGDTTLLYTVVYAHSFLGPRLIPPHFHHFHAHHHDNHNHHHSHNGEDGIISPVGPAYPEGLVSLLLEFNGQTELSGDRFTYLQLLTGVNYALTESAELRFGINFPINQFSRQMDVQYIFAFTWVY